MVKKTEGLNIANSVHKHRAQLRMTQEELANAVGVTRATINAIEKGNYNPTLELAFKLSRFFAMEVSELFFIEEKK